MQSVTNI